jgi:hypothetical protein
VPLEAHLCYRTQVWSYQKDFVGALLLCSTVAQACRVDTQIPRAGQWQFGEQGSCVLTISWHFGSECIWEGLPSCVVTQILYFWILLCLFKKKICEDWGCI